MIMTVKELIAEVTTTLKQYEESGIIDHRSLKLWTKLSIKGFGSVVMTKAEAVIDIENGSGDLPDNFWSLELALKCETDGYHLECGEESNLMRSQTWKTRTEENYVWDNYSNQHIGVDYTKVTLREYIDKNTIVDFRYNNLTPLTLVKGAKREFIADKCKNKFFQTSQYEVNVINGNKLQTNFNKGFVYLQYNALPTDEEGNLYIPDSDKLIEYLQYHLIRKVLEGLWINGDDENLQNKIAYYTQKERECKALATTQLKFEALGKNWAKKLKKSMRRDILPFEKMFPQT